MSIYTGGVVYVALLRAINVGGKNIIKMAALREQFEALGYTAVTTYIQSGNVVFTSKTTNREALTTTIESALGAAFGYDSKVVVVSAKELREIVAGAPLGFGKEPTRYRYDVLFVRRPLTGPAALTEIEAAPGVDDVHAGSGALYFRRLIAKSTKSRLPKIVQKPVYKSLTIRNWNTTTKLLAMTDR